MKNNKGFTLVELLAVIVVLSIVLGLTVYIALNAINKAKEKSYQVTINNIEKEAGNYLFEMKDKLFYVSPSNDEFIEYQNDEYGCGVIGKIVNVSADEEIMTDGIVDIKKLEAIAFDPYTHGYYKVTDRVGDAFKIGLELK